MSTHMLIHTYSCIYISVHRSVYRPVHLYAYVLCVCPYKPTKHASVWSVYSVFHLCMGIPAHRSTYLVRHMSHLHVYAHTLVKTHLCRRADVHVHAHSLHMFVPISMQMSTPIVVRRRCLVQGTGSGALFIDADMNVAITNSVFEDNGAVPAVAMHACLSHTYFTIS